MAKNRPARRAAHAGAARRSMPGWGHLRGACMMQRCSDGMRVVSSAVPPVQRQHYRVRRPRRLTDKAVAGRLQGAPQ